jgi:hypothetical protein
LRLQEAASFVGMLEQVRSICTPAIPSLEALCDTVMPSWTGPLPIALKDPGPTPMHRKISRALKGMGLEVGDGGWSSSSSAIP